MDSASNRIEQNRSTWNQVCSLFANASSLPFWGPFGIGDDLDLIPNIQGKTFLEVGCGSGRSMKFLLDHGAKSVYGLDISDGQIEEARRHLAQEIKDGRAYLIRESMEERVAMEQVDTIFSIYGIGWTHDPEKTLANIHAYLKPGGRFIWSWDHAFFTNIGYEDGKYVVRHSYHDEELRELKNWKKEGCTASIIYRKTDSWFRLLLAAGFEIVGYHEPKPKNLYRAHAEPERYYSFQKAEQVPASFIFVCSKKAA